MSGEEPAIWNIFVNGMNEKTRMFQINKGASVDDLFILISENMGIPKEELRLQYTKYNLTFGKGDCMADYGMDNNSTVCAVLRLQGGAGFKKLPNDVRLSQDPDMITLDEDTPRAMMPCGHAICPDTLTLYCRTLLDEKKHKFICPYENCGKEWPFDVVRRLAVLTTEEVKLFETKMSENSGIQPCPNCLCLHPLNGSGTDQCGNIYCSRADDRLKVLSNTSMKIISGVASCPSIRACPSCSILIEHVDGCSQMTCQCGHTFCFICLRGSGYHVGYCRVAAIQN